ncbi:mRNA splicing protein YJU2 Ecym_2424 [Eremothecium cymbalariae DBVPG|uniref:Splicing factor YJU2 n=1 Tax=Eremothecium cymbalariae (strain CBS 270.75 / DBVPG 7215 / KCTC 17166 / NRRL Y-17582) TaxID=931890 RepID=G8JP97_ERECY|nr:Hypothetical protein Ecym_2424 [Eremothecium cymbalariae DBVPG\
MSERKVINKYYPPDYDPQKAEKQVRQLSKKLKTMRQDSVTIRLMTPFSIRCLKCSEYIPKFRKFNGKKEVLPEKYLETIKIYRLSIKCPRCNSMISFKTDPNRGDYTMEVGGVRNYTKENNNSQIKPDESTEETLERLLKEEEEQNLTEEQKGKDRLEHLEERLAKLQQEQADDEAIEALQKNNLLRMKRAAALDMLSEPSKVDEEQDNLDDLTAQAFRQYEDQEPKEPEKSLESSTKETKSPQTLIPTKIQVKKKHTSNSLGVVVKKRKTKKH